MLVKIAKKIVDKMSQGLTNSDLHNAIVKVLHDAKRDPKNAERDHAAIQNEYVQHAWKVEDLTGARVTKKKIKKTAAKKTASKTDRPFPKPQGRTRVFFALVLAGASNADGLAFVKKEFPGCPTTINSLGWTRSQLRNNAGRWVGRYGVTAKNAKNVPSNKDCHKVTNLAKRVAEFSLQ